MSASSSRSRETSTIGSLPPAGSPTDPRLGVLCDAPLRRGAYVLYWCRAYRRGVDSLALDHACMRADELRLPLIVYEALDVRYPHASARTHSFVLEGVAEMRSAVEARNARHVFFLPKTRDEARQSRALASLAARAALVVTDAYVHAGGPSSLWARSDASLARLGVRVESYDDAAVVALRVLTEKPQAGARTLRPLVHRWLEASLVRAPERTVKHRLDELALPFDPTTVTDEAVASLVQACEVNHAVTKVSRTRGGAREAQARLNAFVRARLGRYASHRNDMAEEATTGLSAHLHFGMISARSMALAARASGAPREAVEGFIEELVVRRGLAFNHVATCAQHATYESVPAWARAQLEAHAGDRRAGAHTRDEWEQARTADALWNAAQRELLRDGVVHPYARMLWGKVALTLASSPRDAFAWLVYLNDKYALDGRDPNTYENIGWCFGLHDHPYPPREVYGTVRSMTSRSAAQKWDVDAYVSRVGAAPLPSRSRR